MPLPPDRLHAVHQYRAENGGWREHGYALDDARHGYAPPRKEHHAEWNVTAEPSVMDRIIDWKIRSPAMKLKQKLSGVTEEVHLIRQFTIELRVNYADADKNETMRTACAAAARHMFATANLLADGTKPEIAIFSDDWFAGKEEISLMQDVIQQGLDESSLAEGEVSSELMAAVRDSGT